VLTSLLISWGPMILLIGVWVYFMRQMQGGGKGGAFSFGKSRARMLDESNNSVTFADVAGCDEAKEEVKELVDFLRDPQKFQKLGRSHSARRVAGRPSGHRQDAAGQVHCGRGQGAVLHHLGFGLR
jgi:ATP-dependent Zn protease